MVFLAEPVCMFVELIISISLCVRLVGTKAAEAAFVARASVTPRGGVLGV